ncbi:hypothetical protein OG21DRAFT_1512299 [Imleria badia]|nr:hypothetical protein OG21DRAFT_1512299 [Imleria badia]
MARAKLWRTCISSSWWTAWHVHSSDHPTEPTHGAPPRRSVSETRPTSRRRWKPGLGTLDISDFQVVVYKQKET